MNFHFHFHFQFSAPFFIRMQEMCTPNYYAIINNIFRQLNIYRPGIDFHNYEKIFTIPAIDLETCEVFYPISIRFLTPALHKACIAQWKNKSTLQANFAGSSDGVLISGYAYLIEIATVFGILLFGIIFACRYI